MDSRLSNVLATTMFVVCQFSFSLQAQVGELDVDFAGDGTATHAVQEFDRATDLVLLPDGSMMVFGASERNGVANTRYATLTRFEADGTVIQSDMYDQPPAFGCTGDGFPPLAFNTGLGLVDGDYLGAGYAQVDGCQAGGLPRHFHVLRIDSDGNLLETFEQAEFNDEAAIIYALIELSNGKILAAGHASSSGLNHSTDDIALARYLSDGTLDTGFGTNGEVMLDINGDEDQLRGVVVGENGRIHVAGHAITSTGRDVLAVTFNADGTIDQGFGNNGVFTYDHAGFDDRALELDIQPDGKLVLAGRVTAGNGTDEHAVVLRLDADGTLDSGFGNGGLAIVDTGASISLATGVYVAEGQRLHVSGQRQIDNPDPETNISEGFVAVLDNDGSPDSAFAPDGIISFGFGHGLENQASAMDVDTESGRIAVAGYSGDTTDGDRDWTIAAARLNGFADLIFKDRFETSSK